MFILHNFTLAVCASNIFSSNGWKTTVYNNCSVRSFNDDNLYSLFDIDFPHDLTFH